MTLNNYKLCTLCDKTISLSNCSHHIKTKRHRTEPEKDFKNLSHKICSKCNLSYSKENFFEDKWNQSYCKVCQKLILKSLQLYETEDKIEKWKLSQLFPFRDHTSGRL
jgi:hypothetical protein